MEKEILILTKSKKHQAYCVVGYDIKEKKLIRLTSSNKEHCHSLLEEHLLYTNGEPVSCLDVVKVNFIQATPKEIHKEDWLINENIRFQKIREGNLNELKEIIYNNHDYIFENTKEYLDYEEAKKQKTSIIVALVNHVKIYQNEYKRTKIRFVYNEELYTDIAVTDPDYSQTIDTKYDKAVIVFSLPDSYDPWPIKHNRFYKYSAKIFTI